MIEQIESTVGPISGLINNAGIQRRAPFLDFEVDDYREVMEMNLVSPFIVSKAVAKAMAERGAGRIVNIGSVQSQLGRPTIVPYTASKGGVVLLTRGMCADLGPLGIQVNSIAPRLLRHRVDGRVGSRRRVFSLGFKSHTGWPLG